MERFLKKTFIFVICTDIFDEFMETNELYPLALSDVDDDVILKYFLRASLPTRLIDDLLAFSDVVKGPLAIRSSSSMWLTESSHASFISAVRMCSSVFLSI